MRKINASDCAQTPAFPAKALPKSMHVLITTIALTLFCNASMMIQGRFPRNKSIKYGSLKDGYQGRTIITLPNARCFIFESPPPLVESGNAIDNPPASENDTRNRNNDPREEGDKVCNRIDDRQDIRNLESSRFIAPFKGIIYGYESARNGAESAMLRRQKLIFSFIKIQNSTT